MFIVILICSVESLKEVVEDSCKGELARLGGAPWGIHLEFGTSNQKLQAIFRSHEYVCDVSDLSM